MTVQVKNKVSEGSPSVDANAEMGRWDSGLGRSGDAGLGRWGDAVMGGRAQGRFPVEMRSPEGGLAPAVFPIFDHHFDL